MRGSLHDVDEARYPRGIIPAGAGLTLNSSKKNLKKRDHPRGCGAHCKFPTIIETKRGSSPRVRGSLILKTSFFYLVGIIPAGAGLTHGDFLMIKLRRDHPRGCGAHHVSRVEFHVKLGSSPRVRGSLLSLQIQLAFLGIIPAGAGLTQICGQAQYAGWDHPRGCGAHAASSRPTSSARGSSPRVRGSQWCGYEREAS